MVLQFADLKSTNKELLKLGLEVGPYKKACRLKRGGFEICICEKWSYMGPCTPVPTAPPVQTSVCEREEKTA